MSHEQLVDVARKYYAAIGTQTASRLSDALEKGDWDLVVKSSTDPSVYQDAHAYRSDAAATSFLRKLEDAPSSIDTGSACLEKWWAAEKKCFLTNRLIYDCLDGESPETPLLSFLGDVRKKVARLIGKLPADLNLRFGKGTTFQHKGDRHLVPDKLSSAPEMTEDAWIHLRAWGQTAWARALQDTLFSDGSNSSVYEIPVVRGNRYASVPKTALTDRAIAIEPTLNLSVQLAIGKWLKGQLKLSGLLTENSEQVHRRLARKASFDGSLATIDLSSASDTVATALVSVVVPSGWYDLLSSVRCTHTLLPSGNWVRLEKFSSMGNGYTFELETIIFASICRAVADRLGVELHTGVNFSVYGDDILVPSEMAAELLAALQWCGFIPNETKTFVSGPFRESCGGDFFNGADVRPVFVKSVPKSPAEWFTIHNMLYRMREFFDVSDVLNHVVELIPSALRLYGPSDLGDVVLHGPADKYILKRDRGLLKLKVLVPIPEHIPMQRWDWCSVVASKLYGVHGKSISPRGDPLGYRTSWVCLAL